MPVLIYHAAGPEAGGITGEPGDQTTGEVCGRIWWDYGWTHCLRCLDPSIAEGIAKAAKEAAENDWIGYSQINRHTAYVQYKGVKSIRKINHACDVDCSSLAALCARIAGVSISADPAPVTATMVDAFVNTGIFLDMTHERYLREDTYLLPGDILVLPGKHCIIVYEGGSGAYNKCVATDNAPRAYDEASEGYYSATGTVNMRRDAGVGYEIMAAIPRGTKEIYCSGGYSLSGKRVWRYVSVSLHGVCYTGFVSSLYLKQEDKA